jgi:hypothetical protein
LIAAIPLTGVIPLAGVIPLTVIPLAGVIPLTVIPLTVISLAAIPLTGDAAVICLAFARRRASTAAP